MRHSQIVEAVEKHKRQRGKIREEGGDLRTAVGVHLKAILPVHIYGHSCDMDPILEIAREYDLVVIEDAAHALPAKYKGRQFEELQIPTERPEVEHAWHLYVLRLNLDMLTIDRVHLIEELKARNIGASVYFIPIYLHSYLSGEYGYKPEDFPVAYREYQRIISLPLYPRMSDQDVEDVIEAISDVVKRYRR